MKKIILLILITTILLSGCAKFDVDNSCHRSGEITAAYLEGSYETCLIMIETSYKGKGITKLTQEEVKEMKAACRDLANTSGWDNDFSDKEHLGWTYVNP